MKLGHELGSVLVSSFAAIRFAVIGIVALLLALPSNAIDHRGSGSRRAIGPVNVVATAGTQLVFNSGAVLLVADISKTGTIEVLAGLELPDIVRGVDVADGHTFVANGRAGLQVVDIGVPSQPEVVGVAESPTDAWDVVVQNGFAYVADIRTGLRIIDVTVPSYPVEVAVVADDRRDSRHPRKGLGGFLVRGSDLHRGRRGRLACDRRERSAGAGRGRGCRHAGVRPSGGRMRRIDLRRRRISRSSRHRHPDSYGTN